MSLQRGLNGVLSRRRVSCGCNMEENSLSFFILLCRMKYVRNLFRTKGDGDCKVLKIAQQYCFTGSVSQGCGHGFIWLLHYVRATLKAWLGTNTPNPLRVLTAFHDLLAAEPVLMNGFWPA